MKRELALVLLAALIPSLCASQQAATPPAPAAWEMSKDRVDAITGATVSLNGPGGVKLHTYKTIEIKTFRAVYERISATTGFTGARLIIKDDATLNAFASRTKDGTPIVVFHTGLLDILHGDPDELAAIMGHEFGHQVLHHKGYQGTTDAINLATSLLDAAIGLKVKNADAQKVATQAGNAIVTGTLRSFDRDLEREADEFGVKSLIQAGFNPEGAARLWDSGKITGGGWLTTHPASAERSKNVRVYAVKYASLAPPADSVPPLPKESDIKAPRNPIAEMQANLKSAGEAHCKKPELAAFYGRTTCETKDISFDQLADASKATEEQKVAIQQVAREVAEFNRVRASTLRQFGNDKAKLVAKLIDTASDQEQAILMDLYTGKNTWGEFNKRRQQLSRDFRDKLSELPGAASSAQPPSEK